VRFCPIVFAPIVPPALTRRRSAVGVVAFAVLVVSQILLLQRYFPGFSDTSAQVTPHFAIVREGLVLAAVLIPTVLLALAEQRSPWAYGLRGEHRLRYFALGLAWGLTFAVLLILSLLASGHLVFDRRLLSGSSAVGYGLAWGGCFFVVALSEEMLFRGYLQTALSRLIGFWPAAIALSTLFGLVHLRNSSEVLFGIAAVALGGAFFSLALWRTGSLWWGIGFHTAWDWSQSFLFGVPDSGILVADRLALTHPVGSAIWSGGRTGPEASLLVLPVMGVALFAMLVALKPSRTPSGEPSPTQS
jgi:membrane protease YdiL (CAAX protease family)